MHYVKQEQEAVEAAADIEVLDAFDKPFFAPVSTTVLNTLFGQYDSAAADIDRCGQFWKETQNSHTLHYFLEGNADINRGNTSLTGSAKQLFNTVNAIAALDAAYWSKTLALTDILDSMPQARRTEWHGLIRDHKTPKFEQDTVRSTLLDLLQKRSTFLAERVDGIFKSLSADHVTNVPEGFRKRMIIARALDTYGYANSYVCGHINDLRCVIAKFMGRGEPKYSLGYQLVDGIRLAGGYGEWHSVDGGALRIRIYKKGTAHLEVHPNMAWRLNCILAQMHPLAIPAEFRTKPKKQSKEFAMMGRPLPFAVLDVLSVSLPYSNAKSVHIQHQVVNKHVLKEVCSVLTALGGASKADLDSPYSITFDFDYFVRGAIEEVLKTGTLPDQKTHQFYPTPEKLARSAVEWTDIQDGDACLEPSAGTGNIADLLPKYRTQCVELASLNANILSSKGYTVEKADFLQWAESCGKKFDAIVMNPPFSEGRAVSHTNTAIKLLNNGGRLVAILPSSYRGKDSAFELVAGMTVEWSSVFDNEFAGTTVSVVMVRVFNKGFV